MVKERKQDILGKGFYQREIPLKADYDGENKAVVVEKTLSANSKNAVLYIHGFIDYFFNKELAERFNEQGFHFFALDLRKCGRAFIPESQHLHYCRDISEYFEEIDITVNYIKTEFSIDKITLLGHSTGGLIASHYAHNKGGENIKSLVLNSPFFKFNFSDTEIKINYLASKIISKILPFAKIRKNNISRYISSLHRDFNGEFDFDLLLKPQEGIPVYFAWVKAIVDSQKELQSGLNINIPILLLHSKYSYNRKKDNGVKYEESDVVLNVEDMKEYIDGIGKNIKTIELNKAIHDIFLSAKEVREEAYNEMFNFLNEIDYEK